MSLSRSVPSARGAGRPAGRGALASGSPRQTPLTAFWAVAGSRGRACLWETELCHLLGSLGDREAAVTATSGGGEGRALNQGKGLTKLLPQTPHTSSPETLPWSDRAHSMSAGTHSVSAGTHFPFTFLGSRCQ